MGNISALKILTNKVIKTSLSSNSFYKKLKAVSSKDRIYFLKSGTREWRVTVILCSITSFST